MDGPHANSQDGIERALRLAIHYHTGQRDKAGECYMLHLMRVMLACRSAEAMQAAVLHDVLEDTSATERELLDAGVAPDVVAAIKLLTRPHDSTYEDYIERLSGDRIAREVKIADLQDNYRLDRVAYRPGHLQEDRQRIERYILAHGFLKGSLTRDIFLARMRAIA